MSHSLKDARRGDTVTVTFTVQSDASEVLPDKDTNLWTLHSDDGSLSIVGSPNVQVSIERRGDA